MQFFFALILSILGIGIPQSPNTAIPVPTSPPVTQPAPPPSAQPQYNPYMVNQGSEILIGTIKPYVMKVDSCTVGYVDRLNNRLYTASHCGSNGQSVYHEFNHRRAWIGTFHKTDHYDLGYVQLQDPKFTGINRFSSDGAVAPRDLQDGDEICVYSSRRNMTSCGTYVPGRNSNGNVYLQSDKTDIVIPGDSGGPMWSPTHGNRFVSVIFGAKQITLQDVLSTRPFLGKFIVQGSSLLR